MQNQHTMKPLLEPVHLTSSETSFRYYIKMAPRFEPYWHYHPEIELTYIKQGQGVRFVGDHISNYQSNDLVLLGENIPHHWVSGQNAEGDSSVAYVIQFSADIFKIFPECEAINQLIDSSEFGISFSGIIPEIFQKIESIETLGPVNKLMALLDILNDLVDNPRQEKLSGISFRDKPAWKRHHSRVSEVMAYILNYLDQNLSLEKMAEMNHMTPPSFSRWFKQSTGKNFITYLNTVRIEKACELLIFSDLPIIQISLKIGYESLSNFNRNFKKMKHVSPRNYRKERGFC